MFKLVNEDKELASKPKAFSSLLASASKLLSSHSLIYLASVAIGIGGAVAAIILKSSVAYLEQSLRAAASAGSINIFVLALPPVGIVLTVLFTKRIAKADLSHGVSKVLSSISTKGGVVPSKMIWAPLAGCTITVGFGGSVGMEAPIMHSGSAIGSAVGRVLRLNYRERVLLVGCGTAAAVAAIFKAPIAGALFAIEILMIDLTNQAAIPLLISSVTAALFAKIFSGQDVEFTFAIFNNFDYRNIPFYLVLGFACGLIATYIRRLQIEAGKIAKRIQNNYLRAVLGGLALALLILFFPPLFGEGYSGMKALLTGNASGLVANSPFFGMKTGGFAFVAYMGIFILVKGAATAITGAAGGVGGVFAPSLFMGSAAGFIVARTLKLIGVPFANELNFALVGMAGVLSALLKAPLTSIFLIAEITGGYALLVPLILTSGVAYVVARRFSPYSIYAEELADRRELVTHHKDRAALALMNPDDLIESDYLSIPPEATIADLADAALETRKPILPIIGSKGSILGIIRLDEARKLLLLARKFKAYTASDFASAVPEVIGPGIDMTSVLDAFDRSGAEELPCVDGDGRFIGFILKSRVLAAYRSKVLELLEDRE
jgi:CIC family chloride channel protein